jgi:hypothetical protein
MNGARNAPSGGPSEIRDSRKLEYFRSDRGFISPRQARAAEARSYVVLAKAFDQIVWLAETDCAVGSLKNVHPRKAVHARGTRNGRKPNGHG